MYDAGTDYRAAVAASTRESKISIKVTTTAGAVIDIDDSGVMKDTVYYKNQAIDGSSLTFGAVYAGEFGAVIHCAADRYSLYDAEVVVEYSIKYNDSWVNVNIGTFYITEANRIGAKISIKALDSMLFFDEDIKIDTLGTVYNLLNSASEKVGVRLAQTKAQIDALPNAAETNIYTVYADRVGTYRDLLSYVAMLTGTFATINRDNKLELRVFHTTSDLTIANDHRKYGGSVSDYKSKITAVTARFLAEENYYPYTAAQKTNDGLLLDLGDIPIVYGLPEVKNHIMQAILEAASAIEYTPAQFEIMGDPTIELGDRITLSNTNHSTVSVDTIVTSLCWNYRKLEVVKGAGDNPRLQHAKSKSDRSYYGLSTAVQSAGLYVASYENAEEKTLSVADEEVITLKFATTGEASALFNATLIFSVDSDTTETTVMHNPQDISFLYKLNGEDISPYTPTQTVQHGHAIITLHYPLLKLERNKSCDFRVYAKTTGGTIKAAVGAIKATVSGSNLSGGLNNWDGTIELEDTYTAVSGDLDISVRALAENIERRIWAVDHSRSVTETMNSISSAMTSATRTLTDVLSVGTKIDTSTITEYDCNERYVNNGSIVTQWKCEGIEQTIDRGKMIKIDIQTDDITVTEIEVTVE